MIDKRNAIILALCALLVVLFYALVVSKTHTKNAATHVDANTKNVQQETIEWKLATSWPKGFPGLGTAPEAFADMVNTMSQGRLHITVYGAKEIVPALAVFDAVSNGNVEMGHSGAYYWKGKIPASAFFTTIPFGMNAQEMNGWLYEGGGLELWAELYEPFNILPLAGGNTGIQMAGWFNKEINSLDDMNGLIMRIPGIAGEVFTRVGGQAVNIPGGDLYTSLKTGVIDATEWVGPYNDLAMGFHEVAKYYYYPGWHEPGPTLELTVNKNAFEALPEDLQLMVKVAAQAANQAMLNEYTARNHAALQELISKGVELRKLPDDVLRELKIETDAVIQKMISDDAMAEKVYASYSAFAESVKEYHRISEKAYINARDIN